VVWPDDSLVIHRSSEMYIHQFHLSRTQATGLLQFRGALPAINLSTDASRSLLHDPISKTKFCPTRATTVDSVGPTASCHGLVRAVTRAGII